MNENEILDEINETWATLSEKVSSFREDEFNRKPAPEKWPAGQVTRHLIKANSNVSEWLNGETKTTSRAPDEKVEQIKSDFLNLGNKMDAADFLVPEDESFDKQKSLEKLEQIKSSFIKTAENSDLTKTVLAVEFPSYGYLTKIEVLAFAAYHTQRHLRQFDKLSNEIK